MVLKLLAKKEVRKKALEGIKKYTGAALRGLGLSGKSRTASGLTHPVLDRLKVGKRLKEKRDIQDSVVKTKDKVMESLPPEGKLSVRTNVPLKNTNKNISKILDKK